jgi:uncharacterized protein YukE
MSNLEVNDNVVQTSRVYETIAHEITEANQAAREIDTSIAQVMMSSGDLTPTGGTTGYVGHTVQKITSDGALPDTNRHSCRNWTNFKET